MRPAVFLDRDGTLVEEVGYLDRPELVALYPWSVDAVRLLNRAGYLVIVVTNQSGIAQGLFDEESVGATHRLIDQRMARGGARIDAYYYCPHHPEAALPEYRAVCRCRKPEPGLVLRASAEHEIDLAASFVIGDRWRDVALAPAVGARGILVRTGYGRFEEQQRPAGVEQAAICSNLMEAVAWLLAG
jgi:D-glycero-D-manno-heptose 1,7-bisphosphate phosphatase